ncbi:hypothetical protein EX30DRAFT_130633 [Ascodesmis nigricans]|uniref:Uncharacterized protein n=1 Tax=Ascodesmis nigricans TaxID=341454 RepID=A0A4S2MRP3_9PEZI|nr:hypothetical protein EX30DRAFT_130633 [Ascodesmis nigricans]
MTERPLSRDEAARPSQTESTEKGPDDVIAMVQAMRAEGFSVNLEGKEEVRSEKEEDNVEVVQVPTTMYPSTAQMDALDKLEGNTPRKFDVISPLEEIQQQYGYQQRNDMPHDRQYYHRDQIPPHHDGVDEYAPQLEAIPVSRPESATGSLFEDFDGVHYSPDDQHEVPTPPPHPVSSPYQQPHHRPGSSSYFPPQSKSPLPPGVVYYPARVPAVINLPPLLSKSRNNNASAQRQDRRTVLYQGPGTASLPDSTSATTLDLTSHRRSVADVSSKRLSALPASLRASAFFESMAPPSVAALPKVDTQQANGSAQKTLDLILDASATAPPAAFTDHPITGLPSGARTSVMHPGRASVMMMNPSRTSLASPAIGRDITVTHHPGETPRSGSPVNHRHSNSDCDGDDESDEEGSDSNLDPHALPTTLLAELAQRKAQQKSRTRTAASAFPTGMHSTLLELDAVAQVQAATRRKGRPVLAWEDQPDTPAEAEDEDVPLGVLFPKGKLGGDGKGMANDEPRGLLMKKELEDSEPLAKRRERLVKEKKRFTITVPIPHVAEDAPGEEGEEAEETLAQRRERLKRQQSQGLSTPSPSLPHDDPEDEPLAQRRLRLQAQQSPRANTPMSMPRQRQSLITTEISREQRIKDGILMVNSGQAPVGRGGMLGMGEKVPPGSRVASRAESRLESRSESRLAGRPGSAMMLQHPQQQMGGLMAQQQQYQQQQMMMLQQQQQQQMYNMDSMGQMGQMGQLNPMQIQMQMQMQMGMGMGYGPMNPMMQQDPQMNQKQREFVERWRTSIM